MKQFSDTGIPIWELDLTLEMRGAMCDTTFLVADTSWGRSCFRVVLLARLYECRLKLGLEVTVDFFKSDVLSRSEISRSPAFLWF
jgi:hypothetical protein